eukprot:4336799-Amphidinium_carterae.1
MAATADVSSVSAWSEVPEPRRRPRQQDAMSSILLPTTTTYPIPGIQRRMSILLLKHLSKIETTTSKKSKEH